jgi:hypothetical protein
MLVVICIFALVSLSVYAVVYGDLTFYHGVNYTYKYTYGKTTSTAIENSMQFMGLVYYYTGPNSGDTLLYESSIKYNTRSHILQIFPGSVYASSYFLYFVDDICQHQSTAWMDFDFR